MCEAALEDSLPGFADLSLKLPLETGLPESATEVRAGEIVGAGSVFGFLDAGGGGSTEDVLSTGFDGPKWDKSRRVFTVNEIRSALGIH